MDTVRVVAQITATIATSFYLLVFAIILTGGIGVVTLPKTPLDRVLATMLAFCILMVALRGIWL